MKPASTSTETADAALLDRLCRLDTDVVYFPVRHHSPRCARFLAEWIRDRKPAAVLIEGPSDFNPYLDELDLPHELPIAVYSYCRDRQDRRRGAFYPFCEYSPEWVALKMSRQIGAKTRFIDLPWAEIANSDETEHRYADKHLRYAKYVGYLCERFGVDTFDDLWDMLVEADRELTLGDYLLRAHSFCYHSRIWESHIDDSDRRREAFMAECVRQEMNESDGPVLVVTGGFHSGAILARVEGLACVGTDDPPDEENEPPPDKADRGITLTPYTYERLDNLAGYNAGMPSPGFYSHVWETDLSLSDDPTQVARPLLNRTVEVLREKKQLISTADLIAVETTARALANLRGRQTVWRADLLDAVTAALIKDESAFDVGSPFLQAVLEVLRGARRGRLAEGARRPPLVQEILRVLAEADLEPDRRPKKITVDLLQPDGLAKSRLLHAMCLLDIRGFLREAGPDLLDRSNLSDLREFWQIHWSPEFEAACAEASRYGTSIDTAVAARLTERANVDPPRAVQAAEILLDAALAGIDVITETLLDSLDFLINRDGEFLSVAAALDHVLYLYCFDEALQTTGTDRVGTILKNAFARAIWLLESLGQVAGNERELLDGLRAIFDTFRRAGVALELDSDEFVAVLRRVAADHAQLPAVRGAVVGILWTLDAADPDEVVSQMLGMANPEHLGDFLCGLFALAREVVQRHPRLVRSVDDVLLAFDADEFEESLPALRLAFTYFAPREKHYMLSTLFESLGVKASRPLARLEVDDATAAEALALETRLFEAVKKYGLRGDADES